MISGLVIRPMCSADIPDVIAIEGEQPVWSETQFVGEIDQANGWQYVLISTTLHGYICGRSVLDEAEIVKIAVKQDVRRQRVATQLLNYSLNEIFQNGVCTCHLEVRASNKPARCFYEKNGFSVIGVRKNYYTSPREDAVMMLKELG